MGAASAVIGALGLAYSVYNSEDQKIQANRDKEDAKLALEQQATKQKKLEDEAAAKLASQEASEAMTVARSSDVARRRAKMATDRRGTLLTGPMALSGNESAVTGRKTLLGM